MEVIASDSWFIHCTVDLLRMNGETGKFVLSCVYGNSKPFIRKIQWTVLPLLKPQNDEQLIVTGDFNEAATREEKQGGQQFNFVQAMPFLDMIAACEFIDLGFIGTAFTWTNQQCGRRRVWERLDRILVNAEWMSKFPAAKAYHEMSTSSDHKFLLLKVCNKHHSLSRPFRSEAMWLQDRGCEDQVRMAFDEEVVGSPSFTLCKKLKYCQRNLSGGTRLFLCI
ncbi:hypothetical protein IFM89_036122 [Coptis chinensis]|uniref:Endonuclease/exonuclease/phosphatase domain-containing protein n=1 Tax=Coptis chinensis TaxID=261450 RepID=A0A835HPJ9_9MAGN|nr:hypothetical protein IFM89_036122 [Coptis chinensis]